MGTRSDTAAGVAVMLPRRAVIDAAWRAVGAGVGVFSSDDGAPLTRTVKRIIDPLVLRLRANPQYSAPVVPAAVAAEMTAAITGHQSQLRSAAAWFEILKAHRRRARITTGNAQELYFPVCFELAVTQGPPRPASADTIAVSALDAIHGSRDRTAIEVLNRYVAESAVIAGLTHQRDRSWRDVQPGHSIAAPFLAGLTTVLGAADTHRGVAARQRVWSALIGDETPYNLGALARTEPCRLPWSLVGLGLSSTAPQEPPPVCGAGGERPLDRSVVDRVRSTLRRALDRDELPDIPRLCAEEVDRACAPWGLLGEERQAALVAGIEVAVELAPLGDAAPARYDLSRQIQARLRKEAYVLHARRYLSADAALHPRQQQVLEDLRAFARPYLSRLWARLHGRDVWQDPCDDVEDVRALLEGVARSVSLDHRQRIKAMLEVQVAE